MLEVTFFNIETQEKGTVICEELTEHGGEIMCCHAETVTGAIDPVGYFEADYEVHVTLPTSQLSSVIAL